MTCKNCGKELPAGTDVCPFCGKNPKYEIKSQNKNRRSTAVKILIAVLIFLIGITTGYGLNLLSQKKAEEGTSETSSVELSSNKFSETSSTSVSNRSVSEGYSGTDAVYVFVTSAGKKYHTASCSVLGDGAIQIEIGDAISQGYAPCAVCKPEQSIQNSTQKPTSSTTMPQSTKVSTAETTSQATTSSSSAVTVSSTSAALSENSIVYITESGTKYHLVSCGSIDPNTAFGVTARKACSEGYTPCSVCHPGDYNGPTDAPSTAAVAQTTTSATKQTTKQTQTSSSKTEGKSTRKSSKPKETTTEETVSYFYVNQSEPDDAEIAYYHKLGCVDLSGKHVKISEDEAAQQDYTPCPKCIKKHK